MQRGILGVLLFTAAAIVSIGCFKLTDPLGREDALEETQREYTKLVRWGEIEKASVYVDPALRQEFLAYEDDFEAIHVADFDIGNIHFEDGNEAFVVVTYHAIIKRRATEYAIKQEQRWYRDGRSNTWHVRPDMAGFSELFN
jgi:hypothetical protein